ncbi:MAG TPA: hypothetical protein PKI71_12670 [Candidatus Rifleibacterium sp.]|nr:hypothetical protein [Candidatus Rifleibacterium sp.]
MTRTGYSCAYLRRKTRHGCQVGIEHYCIAPRPSQAVIIVDPMSCNAGCSFFTTLADFHRRPARPETGVELL